MSSIDVTDDDALAELTDDCTPAATPSSSAASSSAAAAAALQLELKEPDAEEIDQLADAPDCGPPPPGPAKPKKEPSHDARNARRPEFIYNSFHRQWMPRRSTAAAGFNNIFSTADTESTPAATPSSPPAASASSRPKRKASRRPAVESESSDSGTEGDFEDDRDSDSQSEEEDTADERATDDEEVGHTDDLVASAQGEERVTTARQPRHMNANRSKPGKHSFDRWEVTGIVAKGKTIEQTSKWLKDRAPKKIQERCIAAGDKPVQIAYAELKRELLGLGKTPKQHPQLTELMKNDEISLHLDRWGTMPAQWKAGVTVYV